MTRRQLAALNNVTRCGDCGVWTYDGWCAVCCAEECAYCDRRAAPQPIGQHDAEHLPACYACTIEGRPR